MRDLAISILALLLLTGTVSGETGLFVETAKKEVVLKGYTRGKQKATLSSEVTGRVLQVNYDVGDVAGKTPFVRVDPTFISFQIETLRYSIKKLDVAIQQSDSRTAFLLKEFNRFDTLYKGNSAAENRRDAAREEYEQARLERESIVAEKGLQGTRLNELIERRKRHDIYAPAGWIFTQRTVDIGEIITPGTPLATVTDFSRLEAPLAVSAAELAALQQLPQKFQVALNGRKATASIGSINPEFNEKTRKLEIEIEIRRFKGDHRGGLEVAIPLRIRTEGFQIPRAAVVNRYDNPKVRLKQTGEEIRILILGESNDHILIAEDERLSPGLELAYPE